MLTHVAGLGVIRANYMIPISVLMNLLYVLSKQCLFHDPFMIHHSLEQISCLRVQYFHLCDAEIRKLELDNLLFRNTES